MAGNRQKCVLSTYLPLSRVKRVTSYTQCNERGKALGCKLLLSHSLSAQESSKSRLQMPLSGYRGQKNVAEKTMELIVNGEVKKVPSPLSVEGLLSFLELDSVKIAVELNLEIVPRSTYTQIDLKEHDRLEIVHFVGGG